MDTQFIAFPFDWSKIRKLGKHAVHDYMERFAKELEERQIETKDLEIICILWLEIRGVYKGSKYDDTCISEITGK